MNKKEIWKDIKGYEGCYKISNLSRVKSLKRYKKYWRGGVSVVNEKILKSSINSKGYVIIRLAKDGSSKTHNLHILVAIAFLGHIPDGHKIVVDHDDNNKLNNEADNLRLITNRKNCSKDKKGGSSKYVGVHWNKADKKWKSSIHIRGKRIYLGGFDCEIAASKAYQNKLATLTE